MKSLGARDTESETNIKPLGVRVTESETDLKPLGGGGGSKRHRE